MAGKGGMRHTKRLATPKAIALTNKKESKFIVNTTAGPHKKKQSIPLGVFIRDILKLAGNANEVKKILNTKQVFVDGKLRMDKKFPVGLMDVVSLPKANKIYRIIINKKMQLIPVEARESDKKIAKIVKKHVVKGGKINLTLHDGKNIIADNNVHVGDSVIISVPAQKILKVLKLEPGVACLITEGKHAGTVATFESIIERHAGAMQEAKLKHNENFITVAKYLMVVDSSYEGAS